jgi:hypothetical protein
VVPTSFLTCDHPEWTDSVPCDWNTRRSRCCYTVYVKKSVLLYRICEEVSVVIQNMWRSQCCYTVYMKKSVLLYSICEEVSVVIKYMWRSQCCYTVYVKKSVLLYSICEEVYPSSGVDYNRIIIFELERGLGKFRNHILSFNTQFISKSVGWDDVGYRIFHLFLYILSTHSYMTVSHITW